MSVTETVKLPADVLLDFVPADYPQNKRAILIEGLYCLQRIHQQRGYDDWLGLLAAFTLITQEVCAELHEPDFRNVRTAKGTPFQTRFLPRWERYEALLPGNCKPLSRAERGNLRDLVRHPEILEWRAAQGEHIQRGMTHPNRLINTWKAQQRAKTAKPVAAKPTDTKPPVGSTDDVEVATLRRQLEQANARVAELQVTHNADTARIRELEDKVAIFRSMTTNKLPENVAELVAHKRVWDEVRKVEAAARKAAQPKMVVPEDETIETLAEKLQQREQQLKAARTRIRNLNGELEMWASRTTLVADADVLRAIRAGLAPENFPAGTPSFRRAEKAAQAFGSLNIRERGKPDQELKK